MSSISATNAAQTALAGATENKQILNNEDFMKILITELTNQDPFEPMKNQDLLNQIASIQQLASSQSMTKSFTQITDQLGGVMNSFDGVVDRLDTFVDHERFSSAADMIGQLVSGTTTTGGFALGKVVAVSIDGSDVLLELDTGDKINMENMMRLGGFDSSDIVGSLIMGNSEDGQQLVGIVESIEIDGDEIMLHLESGENLAITEATIINADTAQLLLGLWVEDGKDVNDENKVQGHVERYRITGAGVEGITLILDTGKELPLTDVAKIKTENA